MDHWTTGARVKIERAKEHVTQFQADERTFFHKKPPPYALRVDEKSEPGNTLLRAMVMELPPKRFGAVAGDAVHNLHSALDILLQDFVRSAGLAPSKDIKFPFRKFSKELKATLRAEIEAAGHGAMDIIEATEPYAGGKHGFYDFHRLAIAEKHHVLLLAVGGITHSAIGPPGFGVTVVLPMDKPICPVEDGAIVYRFTGKMDVWKQFPVHIAFGQGEVFECKAIVPTLKQYAHLIEGIVNSFAALRPCVMVFIHGAVLGVASILMP